MNLEDFEPWYHAVITPEDTEACAVISEFGRALLADQALAVLGFLGQSKFWRQTCNSAQFDEIRDLLAAYGFIGRWTVFDILRWKLMPGLLSAIPQVLYQNGLVVLGPDSAFDGEYIQSSDVWTSLCELGCKDVKIQESGICIIVTEDYGSLLAVSPATAVCLNTVANLCADVIEHGLPEMLWPVIGNTTAWQRCPDRRGELAIAKIFSDNFMRNDDEDIAIGTSKRIRRFRAAMERSIPWLSKYTQRYWSLRRLGKSRLTDNANVVLGNTLHDSELI